MDTLNCVNLLVVSEVLQDKQELPGSSRAWEQLQGLESDRRVQQRCFWCVNKDARG